MCTRHHISPLRTDRPVFVMVFVQRAGTAGRDVFAPLLESTSFIHIARWTDSVAAVQRATFLKRTRSGWDVAARQPSCFSGRQHLPAVLLFLATKRCYSWSRPSSGRQLACCYSCIMYSTWSMLSQHLPHWKFSRGRCSTSTRPREASKLAAKVRALAST